MLLTAPDDSIFEMKLLAYEYFGARKDPWDLNLLRVLLSVRYADGTEARATTYLLTSEVHRLITWFDALLHKQVTETECHFYHGELRFELFELLEEYAAFRASFYFSHGRQSLLPKKREKEYEWLGHLEFDLTHAQLETALSSFKDEATLFPERVSQTRKGNT
ncbi:hypothetical protein ccbrp13_21400 [Ktedonobacteria bacterium brp13]|nr:hypothetical protein ccbrp13_21400 [Ktedonobacteria bacterium brp13]